MLQKSWVTYTCCAAVLIFSLLLVGCPAETPEAEADLPVPDPAVEQMEMEAVEDVGADQVSFEWTEEPTADMIPSGSIQGEMNGEPFEAKTVRLEKAGDGEFELTISSAEIEGDDPTVSITDDDAFQLSFTGTEGETGEWTWTLSEEKDFETAHAWYWYEQDDGSPYSMNPEWAGALVITEWSVEEPDAEADTFSTVLGNAKGRVALVMDDDAKSWVAGEFDAVYYEW